jgi:hypothetical protein
MGQLTPVQGASDGRGGGVGRAEGEFARVGTTRSWHRAAITGGLNRSPRRREWVDPSQSASWTFRVGRPVARMRSSRVFSDLTRSVGARGAKVVRVESARGEASRIFGATRSGRSARHERFSCDSIRSVGRRGSMIAAIEWLAAGARGDVRASRSTSAANAKQLSRRSSWPLDAARSNLVEVESQIGCQQCISRLGRPPRGWLVAPSDA